VHQKYESKIKNNSYNRASKIIVTIVHQKYESKIIVTIVHQKYESKIIVTIVHQKYESKIKNNS